MQVGFGDVFLTCINNYYEEELNLIIIILVIIFFRISDSGCYQDYFQSQPINDV